LDYFNLQSVEDTNDNISLMAPSANNNDQTSIFASPNVYSSMNDKQASAIKEAQARVNVNNFNGSQPSMSTIATNKSTINP
jgi:hypothetical protein